jgi:hypothetical protein
MTPCGDAKLSTCVAIVLVVLFYFAIGIYIGHTEGVLQGSCKPAVTPPLNITPAVTETVLPSQTPTLSKDYFNLHGGDYRKL